MEIKAKLPTIFGNYCREFEAFSGKCNDTNGIVIMILRYFFPNFPLHGFSDYNENVFNTSEMCGFSYSAQSHENDEI